MNKPIYLGQAILDIGKTLMYEFWYNYLKPKYKDKVKLCYMDTDSFIILIFTEDFYKDIANDVDKWFDTSKYDKNDNKPVPIGTSSKKVLGMFEDELEGEIITEFCAPRAKTYAYKMDNDTEKKKAKGTKKCVTERHLKFNDFKDSIFNDIKILRIQQRFKSDLQTIYTVNSNKTVMSSNDDKRLQTQQNYHIPIRNQYI